MQRFILSHTLSPGDIVCLTALVRDIQLTYPGQFEIDVNTTVEPAWQGNPYITKLWNRDKNSPKLLHPGASFLKCEYGHGINHDQKRETIHFCSYFHRDFEKKTGIRVPCHYPHGDLHLSQKEKENSPVTGRYWLLITGGKSDFPVKVWYSKYFQEVSDRLGDMGLGVVQTGATHRGHWHPPLTGDHVVNLVGWGGFREFMQQIYHADGIICGVTAAMHIAAAIHKPCVVLGGGREAWYWEAYVNENKGFGPKASGNHPMPHKYLHTIGLLPCCSLRGCWKNKVVKTTPDSNVCELPVQTPEMPVPQCMHMITPDHVMEAVMQYYTDKSLPPIIPTGEYAHLAAGITVPPPPKQASQHPAKPACATTGQTRASVVLPTGMPFTINPRANVRLRDNQGRPLSEKAQKAPTPNLSPDAAIDHPDVGGKFTAFILFYGDASLYDMHQRCINSFLATVPAARVDLRVGSNQLNPKSCQLLDTLVERGFITKHYRHTENKFKYPVMREMFFDPACPITTKWVLWFDDDSICDVNTQWLSILAQQIAAEHKNNHHMFGQRLTWSMNEKVRNTFAQRPWYTGKPWRAKNGHPSPNGTQTVFANGGFWAITHEAIIAADIPDLGTGLVHNGGDWQIGEQLYQAGFGLKQFNGSKQYVRTSAYVRRGLETATVAGTNTGAVVKDHGTVATPHVKTRHVPPLLVTPPVAATAPQQPTHPRKPPVVTQPKLNVVKM